MISSGGYVLIYDPSHPLAQKRGWVREHRKVWYETYGPIPNSFVIHHINGDKTDNRIENLKCVSRAEHMGIEHLDEVNARFEPYRHLGTKALNNLNHTMGPWNKGTAPVVQLICACCGRVFTRIVREVRRNEKRGQRMCCSLQCGTRLKRKARGE